jgi:hypothetical protein
VSNPDLQQLESTQSLIATRLPARSVISGTSSAKIVADMLKAAEIDLGQPENDPKLPGFIAPTRVEPIMDSSGTALDSLIGGTVPGLSHSTIVTVSDPVRADALRLVDRMHAAIASSILEFKQVRPESMMVVIRPNPETAVHLQMRLVDGQIRLTAHLELGDFCNLSAHWSELQQTFSAQTVHVGDLWDGSELLPGVPNFLAPARGGQHQGESAQHRIPIKTVNQDDFLKLVAVQFGDLGPKMNRQCLATVATDADDI